MYSLGPPPCHFQRRVKGITASYTPDATSQNQNVTHASDHDIDLTEWDVVSDEEDLAVQYPVTHLQDTNRYAPVKLSIHSYYRGKFVALVAGTCTADTLSTSILAFITSDQKLDFDMNLDELDLCMFHRFRASRQRRHGHARSSTFGDIFADGQTA
ncbi:hypothetical protein PLEOSDRAFT_1110111 [Pleurotus ostreatus PC15]|uniref:Uncharacterized protein n=1 Tax=Pleurotus ostreatus (strain PC15) TaxID=1137138 RepID=A0A067N4U2_PLEO1|nr:hypothetical protein PLEOSDRAFT_1110111 [Pleurotus ostreatus PC15]